MPIEPIAFELQVLALLQASRVLTVRWDCGGDENFVYTSIDGIEQQANYRDAGDFAVRMGDFLNDLLELPSVGEFDMKGTGRVFQDGQEVVIEYQSEAVTYWDETDYMTDEELAEMGIVRPSPKEETSADEEEEETSGKVDKEMSEEYSGRRVLFRVE